MPYVREWMTAKEAAKLLGLEYRTLLARIRVGTFVAHRTGGTILIHKNEVERNERNNRAMERAAR